MKLDWYKSGRNRPAAPAEPVRVQSFSLRDATAPEGYDADEDLAAAVNVALYLGQPLLVTGEPGTGKTQLAYSVAWQLGLGEPLVFATKSTSVSKDLFYRYDAIGYFGAERGGMRLVGSGDDAVGTAKPITNFIEPVALGSAILRSKPPHELPSEVRPLAKHEEPSQSVVLIDEIDKAPRDFPNDLLNEIESMKFRIPELSSESIQASPERRPIVILTSNSEKHLPAAFLRRCVYCHIAFPDDARMREILAKRLGSIVTNRSELVDRALELFWRLRDQRLEKPPSTFELLGWIRLLAEEEGDPFANQATVERQLPALVKSHADRAAALDVVRQWLK